jgi:hypothetical protein
LASPSGSTKFSSRTFAHERTRVTLESEAVESVASCREALHSIRIGTCGWSYKDWVGPFYPAGLAPADYLPYYSERFPVVEVDSTRRWSKDGGTRRPRALHSASKCPRTITHEKVLMDCAAEVEEFVSAARVWVLSDQAWMPTPLTLAESFDVAAGPFAYIRLLGTGNW